ncbi:AAA family ATPase [Acinetobacter sp. CFCC 10889]|uniref:AAA family ATPase n=1 Tax=Acinetobacter sp. CFCC 10889 TaxID=1775557 RepID=UPI000DCFB33C|nr:AAA family ATPase [Acinetobacter sp. CFCC 10889]
MGLNLIMPHQHIPVSAIKLSIYSDPCCGKSTLGLAGQDILMLDADLGSHRVDLQLRRSPIQRIENWMQISFLTEQDLKPFKIIVFDTAQRILDSIKTHLAKDQNNVIRSTGNLKLHVQQQANNTFQTFINKLISWNKDIVFLSHVLEVKSDEDKPAYKCPDIGGKNKQEIYRMADCMAYMTWAGTPDNPTRRLLNFETGKADYHSKDCANLGNIELPDLMQNPNFLSDLIEKIKTKLNEIPPEVREATRIQQEWEHWEKICNEARYASEFNTLKQTLEDQKDHANFRNMWICLCNCAKAMNMSYDDEKKKWFETEVK